MRKSSLLMFALLLCSACRAAAGGTLAYQPCAEVSGFHASLRPDGQVAVQWQTLSELGVRGFQVLRVAQDGSAQQPVICGVVGAGADERGHAYTVSDTPAPAGMQRHYLLRMVSGMQPDQDIAEWEGILLPQAAAAGMQAESQVSAPLLQGGPVPRQSWIGSAARVSAWTNAQPADRVRLSLRDEGVYSIRADELAAASGWNFSDITNAMATTNFALLCQGAPVAWYAEGTNLFFYGVQAQSRYAPENVYWVSLGGGSGMVSQARSLETPATTNVWFWNQAFYQGTGYLARVSFSALADMPISYVAFAELVPGGASLIATNLLVDCATGAWTGSITVNLMSFCQGDATAGSYTTRVMVGKSEVGDPGWTGEQYLSWNYPFASASLTGGVVVLEVDNRGAITDPSAFCISYAYTYPRIYQAEGNALRCTGGTGNTITVTGFTTNDLLALDVTVTNLPNVIVPVAVVCDPVSSNWSASFSCGDSNHLYAVVSKTSGVLQPSIRGVRDMDWSSPANAMDYAILVPPEGWRNDIRAVLQPLADFRNQQGLHTGIVDVESIYNQFSYGLVDPNAIHAFCCAGYTNWPGHPLQYVLLAGAGCLDYKHDALSVNDYTACLIPTLIAGQRIAGISFGMTIARDQALGVMPGEIAPEVVIGRLPTTRTQDMAIVVQKTMAYEGAQPWKQQTVVAADWDNTSSQYYPFSTATDRMLPSLLAAGRTVVKSYYNLYPENAPYQGNMALVQAESLLPAFASGSGIFHYLGHSNEQTLGGYRPTSGRLLRNLTSSYNDFLGTSWNPMIATIIGCRVNRWQSLTTTICILPYGVFAPGTGFVAGLGATGDLMMQESADLGVALYAQAATNRTLRLGDVLKQGLRQMTGEMAPERVQAFCLTGDPTLVFRHDVSAMGTPVTWLVQHGFTAPNADLADPNHDGWPIWQEYVAGTDPTSSVLRISSESVQLATNRMRLAFNTTTGATYRVFFKTDLNTTDAWQAVEWSTNAAPWSQTLIPAAAPRLIVDVPLNQLSATQGFYRICWTNN